MRREEKPVAAGISSMKKCAPVTGFGRNVAPPNNVTSFSWIAKG